MRLLAIDPPVGGDELCDSLAATGDDDLFSRSTRSSSEANLFFASKAPIWYIQPTN